MQKLDILQDKDVHLVDLAVKLLKEKNSEPLQTVVSVARSQAGKIYDAINLYHFTGGPCAEAVLMANSHFLDDPLDTIVAVHNSDESEPEIINPCGRCRQMFQDYEQKIIVIVADDDIAKRVGVAELLPYAYRSKAIEYVRISDNMPDGNENL